MGLIEFAPLNIPLERRLQTLTVLYFCTQFVLLGFLSALFFLYLLTTQYYYISLLYYTWFYFDRKTYHQGGRRLDFLRDLPIWNYFAGYFPIKLVKTADLPPDRNYIFGCHPHGIFCFSHFINMSTNATGFSKLFPNIASHLIILNYQFYLPIHRELVGLLGLCSASKTSIDYILSQKGVGNAAAIITGGAVEVLDSRPGKIILTLKKRKGFVRLALKHGASLVPLISFGENELFHSMTSENSPIKTFLEKATKVLTFAIPLVKGRGIFQYSFGFLPHRKPITTVVGAPIDVTKNTNPTQLEVDELHQRYIEAVTELFENNKAKYNYHNTTLTIK